MPHCHASSQQHPNNTQPRIFKTGAVRIVADETMRGLDNEAVCPAQGGVS
ncbi:MAG: hypothetical protein JNJ61_07520 [Anaerolineae bacterium]|nr:hypothetical protein [Anaerolineae bacterium]